MASTDLNANGASNGHNSTLDQRTIPPMGMTGQQFQEAAISAVNDIEKYYTNLPERTVIPSIAPGYLQKLLPSSAPQRGEQWDAIAKDIESKIMPGVTHWQSPKFMAFFPANSTYPGILGEMWTAALTAPAFNWQCSPVVTELETVVLDWLAKILALPEGFMSTNEGGGVIQGSASEAIVTVVVAARERYVRRQLEREKLTLDSDEGEDRACELRSRLVAVGSEQAHSSTKKAAIIAGTRYRSIATSRSNAYAMTGQNVRQKLEELTAKGLHPYYLTVSIGTTNTCAVDDLEAIAAVARDYPDVWIHCDAAYAGAALVLPEYQHLSAQLSFVDSFDMNMHKWLLANFDASALYVQKRTDLTSALSVTPAYLRNQYSDSGLVTDYRDWQIPLGRRFRAIKIWFVLRTWGVEGLQQHIRHHLQLGELFAGLVKSRSDLFSILTPPAFALTVLTVNAKKGQRPHLEAATNGGDPRTYEESHQVVDPEPEEEDLQKANAATQEVFEIIDGKEFFLTSTVIGGVFSIRVVSANPLAEEKYVRKVFEELVEAAESVL
jgi:aromatic-L-amino-acid decarboxylase